MTSNHDAALRMRREMRQIIGDYAETVHGTDVYAAQMAETIARTLKYEAMTTMRAQGSSWDDVAKAMFGARRLTVDLSSSGQYDAERAAERAFELVATGNQDAIAAIYARLSVTWECAECQRPITDYGPTPSRNPADTETNHAEDCARHAADIAAYESDIQNHEED